MQFGGFWIRLGAYVIDTIVVIFFGTAFILLLTMSPTFGEIELTDSDLIMTVINLTFWWIYLAVFHRQDGG